MGTLDLKIEKEKLKYINSRLKRYGLKPDLNDEWTMHGPHSGMNYCVYVGYTVFKNESYCVAIYPRAIYEIDNESKWYDCRKENRLHLY